VVVSWLGRLRDDAKRPHWSDLFGVVPGLDTLIHMIRGFAMIRKKDDE
jgi:hypothetical protein